MTDIHSRELTVNGLTFTCLEAGPRNGELVVLLHGFPETSHMWRPLITRLAEEGFRVLAPDQRGYSPGARPEGKENYRYINIATDVINLADAVGSTRFHLVGHDWGAGAGWATVCTWPQRVASWTALSVPHPAAFGRAIREDSDQKQRSQYINLFVQEGVAEAALTANDNAVLKNVWRECDAETQAEYLRVFSQPGALTGALNWYRGSNGIEPEQEGMNFGPVAVPTLMIWGNKDEAIGRKANEDAAQYMTGPYRFLELDAGHWLIQEAPEAVITNVVAHVKGNLMRP